MRKIDTPINDNMSILFVSVIIPALNEERYIGECLTSLSRLNYPKDLLEIIVVDNGSKDRTVNIAGRLGAKVIHNSGVTISSQRNFGAAQSKGDILAFIDADCVAPVNWLKDALSILKSDEKIGAVGAEYALPENPAWVEKIWDLQIETRRQNGETDWLPSCNIIVSKAVFLKAGGFKEDLITSEDVEFCRRLKKIGYKIISDNRLAVIHLGNSKSVKELFLKEIWRGRGAFQNFLNSLPKVKLTRATSFAFFTLVCIFCLTAGLINGIINRSWTFFSISILAMISSSIFLALKTTIKTHKHRYFLPLAFLYLVYGLARATCILDYRNWKGLKRNSHMPILLYHDIRDDDFDMNSVTAEAKPYILNKSNFEDQIKWLYKTKSGNNVMLVFDDGWKGNYTAAYPILKKYGFTANFFVTIENIGKPDMMTWENLREMADNGMEIGSHNVTHRPPIELSDEDLEHEIRESKKVLEEKLDRKIDSFSSPTGFYDRRIIGLAKKIGYKKIYFSRAALSEASNSRDSIACLYKIGIKRDIDLETFKGIVRGDRRTLLRLRSNQVMRDWAKTILGVRWYERTKALALGRDVSREARVSVRLDK